VPPEHAVALRAPAPADRRTVRRIQPSRGFVPVDFAEIWRHRELLYYFLWRDVKARYKQTFLGPFWAIFRPLAQVALFSVIFGGLAKIKPGDGLPYPLFALGLLPWTYFSSVLTGTSASILNNASILSKVYFPRIYAPLAAAAAPLVDLALTLTIAAGLFVYYQRAPSWHIVFTPFFILLALLAGLGSGLWLAGVVVRYRDVAFALPFAIQLWMYLTPVIYPVTLIPQRFRWLLSLNPITSVIEGFRWSLLGGSPPEPWILAVSAAIALGSVVLGMFFFRRTERTIIDMV
jgi:lipopolysaccharide transport system permease protein